MPKLEQGQEAADPGSAETLRRLRRRLQHFSPEIDLARWSEFSQVRQVKIEKAAPPPYIVFLIFVHFLGFRHWGRSEKVAWDIPVLFAAQPLLLRHQKFGFQILCPSDNVPDDRIVQRALTAINKAIPLVAKLVEPILRQKLECGEMTLYNDFHHLRDRYWFFRSQCVERKDESEGPMTKPLSWKDGVHNINVKIRELQESSHYAVAAIDAYFSLLEHILVLLAAFLDEPPVNMVEFIGSMWDRKFRSIFDVKNGSITKRYFDELKLNKERYRNFFAHGNFRKEGGSILVHVKRVGAIPFTLTKFDNPFDLPFHHLDLLSVNKLFKFFDSFDSFMGTAKESKYGYRFIGSGLPVAFDPQSRAEYKAAMESDAAFDALIHRHFYFADQAVNMDW